MTIYSARYAYRNFFYTPSKASTYLYTFRWFEPLFLFPCMQIKDGFAEGKDLVVTVMSAMGEEQICALKDIGPKN